MLEQILRVAKTKEQSRNQGFSPGRILEFVLSFLSSLLFTSCGVSYIHFSCQFPYFHFTYLHPLFQLPVYFLFSFLPSFLSSFLPFFLTFFFPSFPPSFFPYSLPAIFRVTIPLPTDLPPLPISPPFRPFRKWARVKWRN